MKILFVTQFFDATRGGGEVVFYSVANELAAKGDKVHVIRHKIRDVSFKRTLPNLKVYDIDPPIEHVGGMPSTFRQNFFYILNAIQIGLKIVEKENIDIIHTNNYSPVFVGTILSILTARPLVVTIHDVAAVNGLNFWRAWMNQFVSFNSIRSLLGLVGYVGEILTIRLPTEAIHTVSELSKEDIIKINKNANVWVVPNGLDVDRYRVSTSDIEYGDNILYIGRCIYYKNMDTVIKSMKTIIQSKPEAKLFIIGDGPMKETWKKLASKIGLDKNVYFLGYVSHEQKLALLKNATALVLPSYWEGFGLVILEAWALRKPVIVSKLRPLSDIVEDKENGFCVPPFDIDDWAKKILLLLNDKSLAKEMGQKGFKKLMDQYTLDRSVVKLKSLYSSLLFSED